MDIEKPKEAYEDTPDHSLSQEEAQEVEATYNRFRKNPAMLKALIEMAKRGSLSDSEEKIEQVNRLSDEEIKRLESMGADEMTINATKKAAEEQRKRLMKDSTREAEKKQ